MPLSPHLSQGDGPATGWDQILCPGAESTSLQQAVRIMPQGNKKADLVQSCHLLRWPFSF